MEIIFDPTAAQTVLWQRRGCRWDEVHALDAEVGEGYDSGGIASGADKHTKCAVFEAGVNEAELKSPVQEQAHFLADCPDANADLARRAGRDITAWERLL